MVKKFGPVKSSKRIKGVPLPKKDPVLPQQVEFFTEDFNSKFGFDDGLRMLMLCPRLCQKYQTCISCVTLLRDCLLEFVVPALTIPQEMVILETNHNPVRFKSWTDPDIYISPEPAIVTVPIEFVEMLFCKLVEKMDV